MKPLLCLLLALSGSLAYGATPPSADADALVTRVVYFGDLDLTRPANVVVLHARIRSAASSVCTPQFNERALEHLASTRSCVEQAVARAIGEVQSARPRTNVALVSPDRRR